VTADDVPPIRRLGRRAVFENRVWRVFADAIADASGAQVPDYLVLEARAVPANAIGGVAVLPILADGRIALLRNWRHAIDGWSWEAAKGFVEAGEDPAAAALRELAEETGVTHVRVVGATRGWLAYDLPEHLPATMWRGQYKGQRQKWYALRFLGTDADVNIATAHPEFRSWRWSPLDSLVEMAAPFKRELYADVIGVLRTAL
jgi:putative (di)nucleoside polyphosphate hydrolase